MTDEHEAHPWFPFTSSEVQTALGVFGCVAAVLALAEVGREVILGVAGAYVVLAYLSGLLVHARRSARTLRFVADGGVGGRGYIPAFRRAEKSLFLMHVDDDAPCPELLAIYTDLLGRGVLIQRAVFLRPDARPEGFAWINSLGFHPGLRQRVVRDREASMTRMSFAVVDERIVLVAVPGYEAVDDETYSEALHLRHLLVIEEPKVARAFLRLYEQLWARAQPLESDSQAPADAPV